MTKRRKCRELALQFLFSSEFDTKFNQEKFSAFQQEHDIAGSEYAYVQTLVQGVLLYQSTIDELIQKHSPDWKMERLALVDKNILRIAILEMKLIEPTLAPAIAINEAIEMTKRFAATESRAFVNSLLDKISKISS